MCGPEDPLFTPLLPLARVLFQAKESVHKTPFWENLEILKDPKILAQQPEIQFFLVRNDESLAHKPPNLEILSYHNCPQIWKFSAHKPQIFEIFRSQAPSSFTDRGISYVSSQAPHSGSRKSGPHTPTWKKSWVPPPPELHTLEIWAAQRTYPCLKDKTCSFREKKNICCVEMIHIHSGMIRRTVKGTVHSELSFEYLKKKLYF